MPMGENLVCDFCNVVPFKLFENKVKGFVLAVNNFMRINVSEL